jgi:hypothetical protein
MKRLSFGILVLFLLLDGAFIQTAHAQMGIPGIANTLDLRLRPQYPRPNETVTAFLENYSFDLARSEISWFLDGKLQKKGLGIISFVFQNSPIGGTRQVGVSIINPLGETVQKILTIRPAQVDLLWEAESYTPPFYKGKSLYSFQGILKVIALPSFIDEAGKRLSSKELVFNWKENDNPVAVASGVGKDTFIVNDQTGLIHISKIEVEATSLDKSLIATQSFSIAPGSPEIILYENNPLYGKLYNKALPSSMTLIGNEVKISAVPYFFSAEGKDNANISYKWSVNGQEVTAMGLNKSEIVFRPEGKGQGASFINLQVENVKSLFQIAERSMSLLFNNDEDNVF